MASRKCFTCFGSRGRSPSKKYVMRRYSNKQCFGKHGKNLHTALFSILSLKRVIVCPECNKSLSYLVTDPNYSKKYVFFQIAHTLPENIKLCPFCKVDLDSEIKK